MSDTNLPALVKLALPLARAMLLTETFRTSGRSAMILDGVNPTTARTAPATRPVDMPVGEPSRRAGGPNAS